MRKFFISLLTIFLVSCSSNTNGGNGQPSGNTDDKHFGFLSTVIKTMASYQNHLEDSDHCNIYLPLYYCDIGTVEGEYFNKEIGWVDIAQYGLEDPALEYAFYKSDDSFTFNSYIDYKHSENNFYEYHATLNEEEKIEFEKDSVDYCLYKGNTIENFQATNIDKSIYSFNTYLVANQAFSEMLYKLSCIYDYLSPLDQEFIERFDFSKDFDMRYVYEMLTHQFNLAGNDGSEDFKISAEVVETLPTSIPLFTQLINDHHQLTKFTLQYGNKFYRRYVFINVFHCSDIFVIKKSDDKSYAQIFSNYVGVDDPYEAEAVVLNKNDTKSKMLDYKEHVNHTNTYLGPMRFDSHLTADASLLYAETEDVNNPYMDSILNMDFHYSTDYISSDATYTKGDDVEHQRFTVTHEIIDDVLTYHVYDVVEGSFLSSEKNHENSFDTTNFSEISSVISNILLSTIYGTSLEVLFPFFIEEGDEYSLKSAYSIKNKLNDYPSYIYFDLYDYRNSCDYVGEIKMVSDYVQYAEINKNGQSVISLRVIPIN